MYDLIQTTLLRRLDHTTNAALRDCMIVLFATTNVQHLIDPAWIRRVGGRTFNFGRLGRRGFASVLDKQIGERPLAGDNGHSQAVIRRGVVGDVTAALYSPNGADEPLIEIEFAGTSAPSARYRRDFLTGSVVDRAVQQAAEQACRIERACRLANHRESADTVTPGLTAAVLIDAIEDQVSAVVGGLSPGNLNEFVNLPDGARVTNLRRLERPAVPPAQLHR